MSTYLNHTAIITDNFDWTVNFFETVCGMTSYQTKNEAPKRQLWFREGIQVNEKPQTKEGVPVIDHICLVTEDVMDLVGRAKAAGCGDVAGKPHWFSLPEGTMIEVKEIGSMPEPCEK